MRFAKTNEQERSKFVLFFSRAFFFFDKLFIQKFFPFFSFFLFVLQVHVFFSLCVLCYVRVCSSNLVKNIIYNKNNSKKIGFQPTKSQTFFDSFSKQTSTTHHFPLSSQSLAEVKNCVSKVKWSQVNFNHVATPFFHMDHIPPQIY